MYQSNNYHRGSLTHRLRGVWECVTQVTKFLVALVFLACVAWLVGTAVMELWHFRMH